MWIADVGQNAWEEVNFRAAGDILSPTNYGWRCLEGTHASAVPCPAPANNVMPIYEYPHNSSGGFVVTGGYVYRGTEYPTLQGYYTMVDYATGNGWLIKSNGSGGWNVTPQTSWLGSITTFGERGDGTLYAATSGGTMYKLTASGPLPLRLLSFTGRKLDGSHELTWEVQQEEAGDSYIIERSVGNQTSFMEAARKAAVSSNNFTKYAVTVPASLQPAYYRLKTMHANGSVTFSSTVYFNATAAGQVKVTKTGDRIIIESSDAIREVSISDVSGRVLYQRPVNTMGMISIPSRALAGGLLLVRVTGETTTHSAKVFN
jgi:hypothetical protein